MGHAPTLTGVCEGLDLAKREAVVDEADVRLPGPFVDIRSPVHDALTEVLRWQVYLLDGPAGLGFSAIRDECPLRPVPS